MTGLSFTTEKMSEIYRILSNSLSMLLPGDIFSFTVVSPDLQPELYNGELFENNGICYRHHSLRCWLDLAEAFNCRAAVPVDLAEGCVRLIFSKLPQEGWHNTKIDEYTEKYGAESSFFRVDKNEEAAFYHDFFESVTELELPDNCRVLFLGCHRGTEFELLHSTNPEIFRYAAFTGIDHSASAIRQAEIDYPDCRLICGDINRLPEFIHERFDLIISIGTLQSPGINGKKLFMQLVQDYLTPGGAVIIGQPNCRYTGHEIHYGAVTRNRQRGEMGLAIADLFFYKKYLQQHKYSAYLRGKYYLLLSGQRKHP